MVRHRLSPEGKALQIAKVSNNANKYPLDQYLTAAVSQSVVVCHSSSYSLSVSECLSSVRLSVSQSSQSAASMYVCQLVSQIVNRISDRVAW